MLLNFFEFSYILILNHLKFSKSWNFSRSRSGSDFDWNRFGRKFVVIVGRKLRIKLCLYLNWFQRKWDKVVRAGTPVCVRGKYAASQPGRFDHTSNTSRKYSFHANDFCLLGQEQLNGNEAKLWEIRQANKVGSDLNYSMRLQKYSQKQILDTLQVFSKYAS